MRAFLLIASARRATLVGAMTALALVGVWVFHDQGLVLDYFPPSRPVGVLPDEFAAVLLAALLPSFSANALSVQERRACTRPRTHLTAYTLLIALIPGLTPYVWTSAVTVAQPYDAHLIPAVAPRAVSFALLGCLGLLAALLAGPLWGPVITLTAVAVLVLAQNAYGAGVLGGALSTGDTWQTNLWIDGIVVLVTGFLTYQRHGVPRSGSGM